MLHTYIHTYKQNHELNIDLKLFLKNYSYNDTAAVKILVKTNITNLLIPWNLTI